MNKNMVTSIKWIPGSETRFVASFNDGSIFIFDTEREEAPFTIHSNEPEMLFIHHSKNETQNPVACWQIGQSPISGFAFSPDCEHIATVAKDGFLRIFDFQSEKLIVSFRSYFGGLICVNWSPDGKYLVTGGEDDLVTIWSFDEQRIIARCEGHQSWVNDVAFDPYRCDEQNYRFGSVGEDARLLLWDFSVNALNRPRSISVGRGRSVSSAHHHHSHQHHAHALRHQVEGPLASSLNGTDSTNDLPPPTAKPNASSSSTVNTTNGVSLSSAANNSLSVPSLNTNKRGTFYLMSATAIEAATMSEVPLMEPITAKRIHIEPLSAIRFREDAIITACRRGQVKIWQRPDPNTPSDDSDD